MFWTNHGLAASHSVLFPGVEVGSAPPLAKVDMVPENSWLQHRLSHCLKQL